MAKQTLFVGNYDEVAGVPLHDPLDGASMGRVRATIPTDRSLSILDQRHKALLGTLIKLEWSRNATARKNRITRLVVRNHRTFLRRLRQVLVTQEGK